MTNRTSIRANHPLLPFIPASELPGDLIQVVEVGAGVVTAVTTPNDDWGKFDVTGWRPATEAELAQDPNTLVRWTSSRLLLDESEIKTAVRVAASWLAEKLVENPAVA